MNIDIAVPTYNSAQWLDAFLESIVQQDFSNWRIVTRDDGSKDGTENIILSWGNRLGEKIKIIKNPEKINLGIVGNYEAIFDECCAELIMVGDPDDVWKPGKITLTYEVMMQAEKEFGVDMPIVIGTDAEPVDKDLKPISPSLWKWARMNTNSTSKLSLMVMENPVLGPTMLFNRPLLTLAMPLNGGAAYHDWWLALVACAFGKIVLIKKSTLLYRRHGANDSLEPLTQNYSQAAKKIGKAHSRVQFLIRQLALQATAFSLRFRDKLKTSDYLALEAASCLPSSTMVMRRVRVIRHGLWFGSFIKNVGMMVFL
ncbi:glycosyl transferase [Acidocella aquatica]|uniref:Glycosyl transferase n=1 Tax=Acidocella aquatica TaxID=1922313 RepID=A0ABQ6A9M2_9PROT|nr:glycosyltransferase [Acidocella aquatica]GLR67312.1 glycosyl transferase [Acidocella aquatica]